MRIVMQQHDCPLATGLAIGDQQRPQPAHECIFRRHRVGHSAGGAGRRALAAARADIGVDRDVISRRRDGARRTKVETAGATGTLRSRVGAQPCLEVDVARFLEGADEISRLEDSLKHRSRTAGIGTQITFAQIGSCKQRGATREIEDDVAARAGSTARGSEGQCPARGWQGLRKVIDLDLKRAEMPLGSCNLALRYRKDGGAWRCDGCRRLDQDGDVEMVLEQVAGLDRRLVATADENDPVALQFDRGRRWRRLGRGCQQRSHLWPGSTGLTGPSSGLANVGKLNRNGATAFGRDVAEQRGPRRAGDRERTIFGGDRAEEVKLRTAELGCCRRFVSATSANGIDVERHRVVARADQHTPGGIGYGGHHLVAGGRLKPGHWPELSKSIYYPG